MGRIPFPSTTVKRQYLREESGWFFAYGDVAKTEMLLF